MVLYLLLAGIIGFAAGVIINALADSMPFLRRPRLPIYPDGAPRPPLAWSGISAFLTGAREGVTPTTTITIDDDKTIEIPNRLKWRHVIVEIFTPLLFMYVVSVWSGDAPLLRFAIWFLYLSTLILITVIDIEHYLILFPVAIPSIIGALILSTLFPPEGHDWWEYPLGALIGMGFFGVAFLGGILFNRLTGAKEVAFGFGDVMLATLAGAMVGSTGMIPTFFLAVIAGGIGAILYLVIGLLLRRFSAFTPLPYGPYIALATAIVMI